MTLFQQQTIFELPLSKDYVRHWGPVEAVRELVQNSLDSESPFEWWINIETGSVTLTSKHSRLPPESLLLGHTTKAEDPATIGKFGEGYKIALLVLHRNGVQVRILNQEYEWVPEFRPNKMYNGAELLCVVQTKLPKRNEGLTFEVKGLSGDDLLRIIDGCLHFQRDLGPTYETPQGRILPERPGKLYVGGLYICETGLTHGYDVKPEHIKLERDRQTVSDWDLKLLTAKMWFDAGPDFLRQVAEMIEAGVSDLQYAEFSTPAIVKEALWDLWKERHPGAVAVKSQEELQRLVDSGMTKVVVVNSTVHTILNSTQQYRERAVVQVDTPRQVLDKWFTANHRRILPGAAETFLKILEQSNKWRLK